MYVNSYYSRIISNLMNNKKKVISLLFFGVSTLGISQQIVDSTQIQQLDEIVITDSKFKLKRENSGKVITKISQAELQNQQGKSIAEIINTTAGLEINGTKSNAGQNLNYYVRGGRNRQVLILIDGVALTDASQIANDYDLRLLNAEQVESIEILKGAASTLYGSGAATAVINIKLKEASNKPISASFRSILGSNKSQSDNTYSINDFRNSVSINGTLNKFNYLASFGNQFTDGLSSLSRGVEPDKDVFNSINGKFKIGYNFSNNFKISAYGSFDDFKAEFDDVYSGPEIEDAAVTDQSRFGISSEFNYSNGSITLNAVYNTINRDIRSSYPANYKAQSFVSDVFNRYQFNNKIYTVLGVNAQKNNMESLIIPYGSSYLEQSINPDIANFVILDPYANMVYVSDFGLNMNFGTRLNNHSEYGSHLVYSINPSFKKNVAFGYLKGLASFSTAYITPSLYQLFEPTYGNSDLQPEENTTLEFGIEVNAKNKATVSLVYFNRKESNFIDFVDLGSYVYKYQNIDNTFNASGLELNINFKFSNQLSVQSNATFTHVEEDLSLRIPKVKINASLSYQLSKTTFTNLSYQFNDSRHDAFFNDTTYNTEQVILNKYALFNFYISHKLKNKKILLFANVTNILNEDYEELYGYSTKGRNINLGLNIDL